MKCRCTIECMLIVLFVCRSASSRDAAQTRDTRPGGRVRVGRRGAMRARAACSAPQRARPASARSGHAGHQAALLPGGRLGVRINLPTPKTGATWRPTLVSELPIIGGSPKFFLIGVGQSPLPQYSLSPNI